MKKIMFNDAYGLTDATIEGRKTMTRRAEFSDEEQQVLNEADDVYMDGDDVVAHFDSAEDVRFGTRYKVGEIVAVAQSYEDAGFTKGYYRDEDTLIPIFRGDDTEKDIAVSPAGWRNKMFTRADLMPHRIRITGIKVERLQDISYFDCLNEGIYCGSCFCGNKYGLQIGSGVIWLGYTAKDAFALLIDKVSGRGTWESNPWVVAYEYELVK